MDIWDKMLFQNSRIRASANSGWNGWTSDLEAKKCEGKEVHEALQELKTLFAHYTGVKNDDPIATKMFNEVFPEEFQEGDLGTLRELLFLMFKWGRASVIGIPSDDVEDR